MASISKYPNGCRRILFVLPDRTRKAIRLGKISQRAAEAIKTKIEHLIGAKTSGCAWDNETAQWVADLPATLAEKLVKVDLIPKPDQRSKAILGTFLTAYIKGLSDVKPATKLVWGHVQRNLVEFFGESRDVRTITAGDADDFKQSLIRQGLAATTIHKRLQFSRTFFRAMLRRKLINENPFAEVKSPAVGVSDRQRFGSR